MCVVLCCVVVRDGGELRLGVDDEERRVIMAEPKTRSSKGVLFIGGAPGQNSTVIWQPCSWGVVTHVFVSLCLFLF